MSPENPPAEMAAELGMQLAERALRYANYYAVLTAIATVAATGNELCFVRDPEKFISDMEQATWEAIRPDWNAP